MRLQWDVGRFLTSHVDFDRVLFYTCTLYASGAVHNHDKPPQHHVQPRTHAHFGRHASQTKFAVNVNIFTFLIQMYV